MNNQRLAVSESWHFSLSALPPLLRREQPALALEMTDYEK